MSLRMDTFVAVATARKPWITTVSYTGPLKVREVTRSRDDPDEDSLIWNKSKRPRFVAMNDVTSSSVASSSASSLSKTAVPIRMYCRP